VADRDFIAEFLFWATLTMLHLSRFAEDLIIYSSREFSFVTLADAYSTGSSLMPQKKNPDALELLRGKSGRVMGQLTGLMTVLKGLPTSYNKDLQEDKEPLFDAFRSLNASLQIACGVLSTLTVNPLSMRAALSPEMLATDLAEYLVRKGVPFRESHHVAGAAVHMAEIQAIALPDLSLEDLQTLHKAFDEDVAEVWSIEASVDRRDVSGGTSRRSVQEQIDRVREWLDRQA
jgi:argininosuccinate lyase